MKRTLLALMLAFALDASAQAKTPKEVLEPYKAYRAALEVDDQDKAADFAYKAWLLAEDLMGDTKTTGDLAANFAELRPRFVDEKQAWKLVMRAHKRSIDLSSLHTEDPTEVEIDRRVKYLGWLIPNLSLRAPGANDKAYSAKRLNERIKELGLAGSTFDAESKAFSAQTAMFKKNWKDVERDSIEAMNLFEARTDGLASIYEFAVPIYLARAYAEQDQPIDAALTYQTLMTKMEKRAGHNNPISGDAYGEWLRLRDEVIESKSEDPRTQDVVNFVVPAGRTKELLPLVRKPPLFPKIFLGGNKSGFVNVRFDVDTNGRVVEPVVISSTNKSLHKATLKSLEDWRYTPNLSEAESRGVEVKIRFDVTTQSGRRLPYGEEKPRP